MGFPGGALRALWSTVHFCFRFQKAPEECSGPPRELSGRVRSVFENVKKTFSLCLRQSFRFVLCADLQSVLYADPPCVTGGW